MSNIFKSESGLIPALDCNGKDELVKGIKETMHMDGVVGYKLGILPVMTIEGGFVPIMNIIRKYTDLTVILDYQKLFFASSEYDDEFDIPPIIAHDLHEAGIDAGIILGLGNNTSSSWYKDHLKAFVIEFLEHDITPIVVAHMTTEDYLQREGGYVPDDVPDTSYKLAAGLGVEYFVIPGNKPRDCEHYVDILSEITEPKFLIPGFGKQGGNENDAIHVAKGKPAYMIIGPYDRIDFSQMGKYATLMGNHE